MNTKRKTQINGLVLSLVVIVMVILIFLGLYGYTSLGMHSRVFATHDASVIVARTAADAGLARAVFLANIRAISGTLPAGTYPIQQTTAQSLEGADGTVCSATYTYKLDLAPNFHWIDTNPNLKYIFDATATGTCKRDGTTRIVHATVGWLSPYTPYEGPVAVKGQIKMGGTNEIAAWNTLNPPQPPQPLDPPLTIRTDSINNDSILLKDNAKVYGNAVIGPGGDPTKKSVIRDADKITGTKTAAPSLQTFVTVTPPSNLQNYTDPINPAPGTSVNISTSGKYPGISLGGSVQKHGILNITAPSVVLYITGNVGVGSGAEFNILPGASLTLYVGGNMTVAGTSTTLNNASQIPQNLQIFGLDTCNKITLGAGMGCDGYAAIYAPDADITFGGTGVSFYGAIVGNSFTMIDTAKLYYDASLRNVTNFPHSPDWTLPGQLVVTRWQDN